MKTALVTGGAGFLGSHRESGIIMHMGTKNFKIEWNRRVSPDAKRRPIVFVSSTVYDKKDMLSTIYSQLETSGYDVRMSDAGTIPVDSDESAFANCLKGVEDADFFIGIISPNYGSGILKSKGVSITHEEMRRARDLRRPRLLLVDERVKNIADFLNHLGFRTSKGRKEFRTLIEHYFVNGSDPIKKAARICDIRSIDLYDEMMLGEGADPAVPAEDRKGGWVQSYRTIGDFKTFLSAQFSYLQVSELFEGQAEAVRMIERHLPKVTYGKSEVKG